jgi:hypothetical protein
MGRIKSPKGPDYKKKGKPAGRGIENGLKDVRIEDLNKEEEMVEKYTDGPFEEPAENINARHPNRNLNKPNIDKPPYS